MDTTVTTWEAVGFIRHLIREGLVEGDLQKEGQDLVKVFDGQSSAMVAFDKYATEFSEEWIRWRTAYRLGTFTGI